MAEPLQPGRMPVLFIAHGFPPLLDDAGWVGELRSWAQRLPRPRAVLIISAHWEQQPLTLGAVTTVPLIYDFYGFPERYYAQRYPAPGAPDLARRVAGLLVPWREVAAAPQRGLDHGAYVPLVAMYPEADVPVLQISLPSLDPGDLFDLGRSLAPLRDEGILIIGSGFLTHNLGAVDWGEAPVTPAWARSFDEWCANVIQRRDAAALRDYRRRAPAVEMALPTHEHFVPAILAMGAAAHRPGPVSFPITGFVLGSLTRRSVQWG